MTQKAKRRLSDISFSHEGAHLALCSKSQGAANNWNKALIMKGHNYSPEFIQKMQQIQVTYELPDFLRKVMGLYYEDAELLARMLGYVEPEKEETEDYDDWYENYIEEKLQSFTIIKSLHEAKSLPDALSKLTEQDYLDVLTDQVEIEKALTKFTKEKQSPVDTSTKNVENTKVEASASKKKKEKQMTQEAEMVKKSELIELQKSLDDQRVALEKALADVKRFEEEKKETIVKAKTSAIQAVVKNEKQAVVVLKAALALEDQADFDAFVQTMKDMHEQIEKSALFQEQGITADTEEKASEKESAVARLIKAQFANK